MMLNDLNRNIHATNPSYKITKFSVKTSTGTIRRHLIEEHMNVWVSGCDELGIKIKAKSAQAALDGYRKGKGQPTGRMPQERTSYSREAFVDAIIEFIVGDDQVYFSIVLYSCIDEISLF